MALRLPRYSNDPSIKHSSSSVAGSTPMINHWLTYQWYNQQKYQYNQHEMGFWHHWASISFNQTITLFWFPMNELYIGMSGTKWSTLINYIPMNHPRKLPVKSRCLTDLIRHFRYIGIIPLEIPYKFHYIPTRNSSYDIMESIGIFCVWFPLGLSDYPTRIISLG